MLHDPVQHFLRQNETDSLLYAGCPLFMRENIMNVIGIVLVIRSGIRYNKDTARITGSAGSA